MNYFEILQWIQENLFELQQNFDETYTMHYIDPNGVGIKVRCDDLISGVLKINECDLISRNSSALRGSSVNRISPS